MSEERFRALPGGLDRPWKGSKSGNRVHYTTRHHMAAVEGKDYFLPLYNYVSRKDEIKVFCERDDGSWDEGLFKVLHSEPRCVITVLMEPWQHWGLEIGSELVIVERGNDKVDVVEPKTGRTVKANTDRISAAGIMRLYAGASVAQAAPVASKSIDEMSRIDLQREMKALTGSGFNPSTDTEDMRAAYKAALNEKAAA